MCEQVEAETGNDGSKEISISLLGLIEDKNFVGNSLLDALHQIGALDNKNGNNLNVSGLPLGLVVDGLMCIIGLREALLSRPRA